MSKVISFSNQAARLEDRAGGGEEWQLAMGEQSRLGCWKSGWIVFFGMRVIE